MPLLTNGQNRWSSCAPCVNSKVAGPRSWGTTPLTIPHTRTPPTSFKDNVFRTTQWHNGKWKHLRPTVRDCDCDSLRRFYGATNEFTKRTFWQTSRVYRPPVVCPLSCRAAVMSKIITASWWRHNFGRRPTFISRAYFVYLNRRVCLWFLSFVLSVSLTSTWRGLNGIAIASSRLLWRVAVTWLQYDGQTKTDESSVACPVLLTNNWPLPKTHHYELWQLQACWGYNLHMWWCWPLKYRSVFFEVLFLP